jgi:acyl-CoA synthetase (NDP forming)
MGIIGPNCLGLMSPGTNLNAVPLGSRVIAPRTGAQDRRPG